VKVVDEYLRAVEGRDIARLLPLFAGGALVHSPLYGTVPATEFYPRLFADTRAATLTLRATLRGPGLVAFWFDFDWTLADGRPAPFEAVDIAELDDAGRIRALHIIYDTVRVRPAFEAAAERPLA
jgi:SnoaL-like protein